MVDGKSMGYKYYIVSELAENGDLFDLIQAAGGVEETVARQLFKQMIYGIEFLHTQNIVHGEMKLQNCLLDQNARLKIANFGTQTKTQGYTAPEQHLGPPVDVFATGVCLFSLLTARQPFNETGDVFHHRICLKPVLAIQNYKIGEDAVHLVSQMIQMDPEKRISIPQIKSHEWLKGKTASEEEVL